MKIRFYILGAFLVGSFQLSAQTVVADFSATPASGCSSLNVSFTDLSLGSPTSWSWNFGNPVTLNDTSNIANPTYTYPAAGTYTVTLIASNAGSSNTKTRTVTVSTAVVADFAINTSPSCAWQAIIFTDNSAAVSGTITSWAWDFGDGSTSALQSPSHTYSFPSTYPVSLIATDNNGCNNSIQKNVQINGPTININGITTICTGTSTTLTATGAGTYLWSTGATTTAVTVSPASTTTYTVTGTNAGCTGSASVVVTVASNLIPIITGNTTICNGSCTTLTGNGGGTYSWSPMGGSGSSITICPTTNTTYTLTVTNGICSGSATIVVTVNPNPVPTITGPTIVCPGSGAALTATGGTTYSWSPGAMNTNSIVVFPTSTTSYTVTAVVSGCTGSASIAVTVNPSTLTGVTVSDSVYKESCLNTGDGAIDITLSGSNPGPFTYQWSNGMSTEDLTHLTSGYYSVTIFDASMNCWGNNYQVIADGTNCGSLSGNVFDDKNIDCIKNSGDIDLSNIKVVANPGNRIAYTNMQGNYIFNSVPYGTYTLNQQLSTYIFQTCSTSLNATLNTSNKNVVNLNFADTIAKTPKDVAVGSSSRGIVPGFLCSINVSLWNYTNSPTSGTLSLMLPAGFGAAVTSGPSGYSIIGDTVYWNYSNITKYYNYFEVFFNVPVNTPLGSIFKVCAKATVIGTDVNPANNYYCYQRYVSGSFDPNDKSVNPIGQGPQGNIALSDNTLDYHINFQNTGNGPAVNIVVKDTLSDKLDMNTLEVTGVSHNYILDVMPGNVLRWKFNNIMLADSGSNEPASHGWISYRVKQKTSNQVGDKIKNTAYIYFDFNSAVVTNTTLNTIATITGIEETVSSNEIVKVFPNPFSDNTTFIIQSEKLNETYSFELLDVLGKQVRSIKEITAKQFQISRNGLPNGIYFYKIYSDENIIGIGKLVIK